MWLFLCEVLCCAWLRWAVEKKVDTLQCNWCEWHAREKCLEQMEWCRHSLPMQSVGVLKIWCCTNVSWSMIFPLEEFSSESFAAIDEDRRNSGGKSSARWMRISKTMHKKIEIFFLLFRLWRTQKHSILISKKNNRKQTYQDFQLFRFTM